MSELSAFIEILHSRKNEFLPYIFNFDLLISSLRELDSVTGMALIKKDIVEKGKCYLVSQLSGVEDTEEVMHHFKLSGPPGCGKTSVCKILAKIYIAFGIIQTPTAEELALIKKRRLERSDDKEGGFLESLFSSVQNESGENQRVIETLEYALLDADEMILCENNKKKKRGLENIRSQLLDSIKMLGPSKKKKEKREVNVDNLLKV